MENQRLKIKFNALSEDGQMLYSDYLKEPFPENCNPDIVGEETAKLNRSVFRKSQKLDLNEIEDNYNVTKTLYIKPKDITYVMYDPESDLFEVGIDPRLECSYAFVRITLEEFNRIKDKIGCS